MNKTKQITLITLALSFLIVSQAEYIIKIDLDKNVIFKNWTSIDPTKTEWTDAGYIYQCSNWNPLASTITVGQNFLQTSTDCKQDQSRTIQEREQDSGTNVIRDVGVPYTEQRTITVSDSQQSIGSLETWAATTASYTNWVNNGEVIACSNWTPDPATITIGLLFTQTANDCKQPQTRNKQDREKESTTLEIRNKGVVVIENQIISATSTRTATGMKETWAATTPTYTNWINNGSLTNCTNWSPSPTTVTVGQSFTQTATDCQQAQTRSRQDREIEGTTGAIRNIGSVVTENQSITVSSTRAAVGTKETWATTTPTYTNWINNGAITACSNWTPSPTTVTIGQSFTQTATDCQQAQTRSRQDKEVETTTGSIRNVGSTVTENQSVTVSSTRSAVGTKETWVATTPTSTAWVNSGAVTGCSNWSPSPTTVTVGQSFTQTATDCQQAQTRSRQDREKESTTGVFRNVGSAVTESQSITASSTRTSTGTKETWVATTPTSTAWVNNGAITACSNWTPLPTTVTVGQSFTQTATDCQQAQTRSRQDREKESTTGAFRNVGSVVTENQSITVSSTRAAVGTKETWAATTPTYTNWINNGAITACSNWTPATSTVTVGQSFTQTATDCKQAQTRSRQDREVETTTGSIRNVGSTVTENQSVTVSSTRAAGGTKETWAATTPTYTSWTNNGALTSCSNWSPSPTTVTIGQSFTQTATDCQQAQTRSRQDREKESTTGAFRNVGSAVTESQSIAASSTRTSTGTKETWVAITPTSTAWVNSGAVTGCSNWLPDPSTVAAGTGFTQTATNCSQSQTRSTQNREQETTTGAIRNVGNEVNESKNITASNTQNAVGTKSSCIYSATDPVSMWKYRTGGNMITIFYEGATIHVFSSSTQTSYTKNGYTYTRGTVKNSVPSITDYSVCRT
jgi:hypothetical protein